MLETSSNGSRASEATSKTNVEILAKPKRRRFSVSEKPRILREADACAAGTVGAYLRREGTSSSKLYAWRRERDRRKLDPQVLKKRGKQRAVGQELKRRAHRLEVENRKL